MPVNGRFAPEPAIPTSAPSPALPTISAPVQTLRPGKWVDATPTLNRSPWLRVRDRRGTYRSNTNRSPIEPEQQIIIFLFEARSRAERT